MRLAAGKNIFIPKAAACYTMPYHSGGDSIRADEMSKGFIFNLDTETRFVMKLDAPKFLYAKSPYGHRRTASCGCGWNPDLHGDYCPEHGNPAYTLDNGPISQAIRSKHLQAELEK